MSAPVAPDDIVRTTEDGQANSRPPLLVLDPLQAFLDEHGLGHGEVHASPIGEVVTAAPTYKRMAADFEGIEAHSGIRPEAGRSALAQLAALGKPVVAVSFGSPYLLRDFPDLQTYLCAWGGQDVSQTATVQALFGENAIGGKLPITIPGLAKRGDGIAKPAMPR